MQQVRWGTSGTESEAMQPSGSWQGTEIQKNGGRGERQREKERKETERRRDRETERQRDRETERVLCCYVTVMSCSEGKGYHFKPYFIILYHEPEYTFFLVVVVCASNNVK